MKYLVLRSSFACARFPVSTLPVTVSMWLLCGIATMLSVAVPGGRDVPALAGAAAARVEPATARVATAAVTARRAAVRVCVVIIVSSWSATARSALVSMGGPGPANPNNFFRRSFSAAPAARPCGGDWGDAQALGARDAVTAALGGRRLDRRSAGSAA